MEVGVHGPCARNTASGGFRRAGSSGSRSALQTSGSGPGFRSQAGCGWARSRETVSLMKLENDWAISSRSRWPRSLSA